MAEHEFTHTNPDVDVHAMGEMHEHPTWREYKWVALVLTLITIGEVWVYYTSIKDTPIFVPLLLLMSAVKFAIVVAFYAPQVRPQDLPCAVHGPADDRDGDADLAALPVRQVRRAVDRWRSRCCTGARAWPGRRSAFTRAPSSASWRWRRCMNGPRARRPAARGTPSAAASASPSMAGSSSCSSRSMVRCTT